jgi:hypothetical protein
VPSTRALPGAILFFVGLLSGVRPASAQPPAAADTSGVFGFLRPTYTTSYNITRQATTWQQGFSFKNQWNGITIDNNTTYRVQSDPSRVNFRGREGSTTTTLSFSALNTVPVSLDFSYSRLGNNDTNVKSRVNSFDSGLKATYNRRFFPGANASLVGGIGLTRRDTRNNFSGSETGSRDLGLTRELTASGNYTGPVPGMSFRVNTTLNAVRSQPEAINPVPGQARSETRTNTRNSNGLTWSWAPWEGMTADASFTRNGSNQNFILVSRDVDKNNKEEEATDRTTAFNSSLGYKPAGSKTTEFRLDVAASNVENKRLIEVERANKSNTRSFNLNVKHRLIGNALTFHAENTDEEQDSGVLGRGVTITRVVDGAIERPWSTTFSTRLYGEVRLRSQTYDDGEQDYDGLKNRFDVSADYKPWTKLSTSLTLRRSADEGNYIDETQSRGSRFEETYGASANLNYTLSTRTSISQKYDFTSLFTSYPFDSALANIQRSRTVNTTVSTTLSSKLTLQLGHVYLFTENGGYRRDRAGTRLFAKSNLKYRQEMRSTLQYKPLDWLTFSTEERLYRTDDVRLTDDFRTTSSQVTFTQRAVFKRPIPGGGDFNCDMAFDLQKQLRPRPGPTEKFFTARLSLDKSF